jgi:guanyl-specific ribonuclease Sa
LVRFYFLLCLGLGFAAAVAPVSARETARPAIAKVHGARRLIAGRNGEFYYTDDHYRTFRRIRE